jgi:hypothetical protein
LQRGMEQGVSWVNAFDFVFGRYWVGISVETPAVQSGVFGSLSH